LRPTLTTEPGPREDSAGGESPAARLSFTSGRNPGLGFLGASVGKRPRCLRRGHTAHGAGRCSGHLRVLHRNPVQQVTGHGWRNSTLL
jgi:hypothetical protein